MLGYKETEYLKSTNEYLYSHNELSTELLGEFIRKGKKGEADKFFKSEEANSLAGVHKLVGTSFNEAILKDNRDHFVYEYSQFCPTCTRVSPVVAAFAKVA